MSTQVVDEGRRPDQRFQRLVSQLSWWRRIAAQRLLPLLVGALLMSQGMVSAQQADRYFYEMRERLLNAAAVLIRAGYQLSHEPNIQVYGRNRYRDLTLTLEGDRQFAIIAVGDDDASNIDLQLFDQEGRLIGEDFRTGREGAVGILQVSTYYTARYTLRVIMRECQTPDCYLGLGIFVRVR